MALTLAQIRQLPGYQDATDDEIVNHAKSLGVDIKGLEAKPAEQAQDSPEEAGALRSYVGIPLEKGVSGVGGAVGWGLEHAGFPETGRAIQASDQRVQQALTDRQSQQAQADAQKTIVDDNGDYGGYNAGTLAQDVFGSAPGMAAMALPGAGLANIVSKGSKAIGVGEKVAEKIAKVASSGPLGKATAAGIDNAVGSAVGFGASEGAFSGAQNASQVQQQILGMDINHLAEHPAFQGIYHQETDQSLPVEQRLYQARDILAKKAGSEVFADTLVKTGLTSMATGGGMFGMLRGGKPIADTLAKSLAKGFAVEGGQEAAQSALEQQTQNSAIRDNADVNQDVNQGVLNAGLQGGIAGGVMGMFGGGGAGHVGNAPQDGGNADAGNAQSAFAPTHTTPNGIPVMQVGEDIYRDERGNEIRRPASRMKPIGENQPQGEMLALPELIFSADGTSLNKADLVRGFMANGASEQDAHDYIKRITQTPINERTEVNLDPYRFMQERNAETFRIGEALREREAIQKESDTADNFDNSIPFDEGGSQDDTPFLETEPTTWEEYDLSNQQDQQKPKTKRDLTARQKLLNDRQDQKSPQTEAQQPEAKPAQTVPSAESQIPPATDESSTAGQGHQAPSFVATHTLSDGTPVKHVEGNIYSDAHGNETEDDYAVPIAEKTNAKSIEPDRQTQAEIPENRLPVAGDSNGDASAASKPDDTAQSVTSISHTKETIAQAAHEAATSPHNGLAEPTPAQKEAGNYKKGHIANFHGLDITIENPQGSTRSGTSQAGKPWTVDMKHHYGYIKRSTGADNEHVDVYVGDHPESTKAFIVNQNHPEDGKFDEHKIMLGFENKAQAKVGYLKNYEKGWVNKGFGSITEIPVSELKAKIESGAIRKPIHENTQSIKQPSNTQPTASDGTGPVSESELNKGQAAKPTKAEKYDENGTRLSRLKYRKIEQLENKIAKFEGVQSGLNEQSRSVPGSFVTGRSNQSPSLMKRRSTLNDKMASNFKELQAAKDELKTLEQWKKAFEAGEVHDNGQPRADAPSRQEAKKSEGTYADYIRSRVKPGDTVTFNPNPQSGGVKVKLLNKLTVTLDSGTKWQYTDIAPMIDGRDMTRDELRADLKVWREEQEKRPMVINNAEEVQKQDPPAADNTKPGESAEEEKQTTDNRQEKESAAESLLGQHAAIDKRITEGKITADEMRAEFEKLASNGDAIMAELSKLTKAELEKRINTYIRPDAKKADLVEDAYEAMITDYWIGEGLFSYSVNFVGKETAAQAKIKKVRQFLSTLTDEAIQKHADEIKQAQQNLDEERKQAVAGMEDPKTLNDYYRLLKAKMAEGMTYDQARMSLSPEQRATVDEMAAEQSRDDRKARADQQKTEVNATATTTSGDIIETKHTKTGEDLFVVKAADRVGRETYDEWNATAKRLGGRYSSYRGNGAIPGFQFKTRESAEAFLQYLGGDVTQAKEAIQERRDAYADDKSQTAVERLNEMADRLEDRGEESLNRDRKANTTRRAGIAARAEAVARYDVAMAETMRNIAKAISDGKAKFLDRVRTKAQIEMLQSFVNVAQGDKVRAKYDSYLEQERHKGEKPDGETADYARYPDYTAFRSDLASLARGLVEHDGTKKIGQDLLKVADDVDDVYLKWAKENLIKVNITRTEGGLYAAFKSKSEAEEGIRRANYKGKAIVLPVKRGENVVILSPSEAMKRGIWKGDHDKRITLSKEFGTELIEKIGKAARRNKQLSVPWQFEYAYDKQKRLAAMGIETKPEFRAALREFIGLSEAPKEADKIKEMERDMIGRSNDGLDFFPTPASVADQMVETAGIKEGMSVLEPSAGMGHIAERIRKSGVEPDVIELSNKRAELLEAKGFNVVGRDFMETEGAYDRIVMNPPFGDRRDAQHVQHAYDLLKPGGRLVAIMGEGVFFGSDRKAQAFRDWLEEHGGTDEKLEEGTFNDPSLPVTTGVNARMVVIDKPNDAQTTQGGEAKFSKGEPYDYTKHIEKRLEDAERELRTNQLTGIPNYKSFLEKEVPAYVAAIDVDSLKYINDSMGHQAGNDLLKAVARVLREHVDAYHVSGDELLARGDSLAALESSLEKALSALKSGKYTIASDHAYFNQPGFSYGIAETGKGEDKRSVLESAVKVADENMLDHKAEREQSGERAARGEMPQGFHVTQSGEARHKTELPVRPALKTFKDPLAAQAHLVKEFGSGVNRLVLAGILNFTHGKASWPDAARLQSRSDEEAVYVGGKAYIDLQATDKSRLSSVLLHEIGEHYHLKRMIGEDAYNELQSRITNLAMIEGSEAGKAWKAVAKFYPDLRQGSEEFVSEVIAKLGETNRDAPWYKQLVSKIKAFLIKNLLGKSIVAGTMKEADIHALLVASLHGAASRKAIKAARFYDSWEARASMPDKAGQSRTKSSDVRFSRTAPQDLWDDVAEIPRTTAQELLDKLKFAGDKGRITAKQLGLSALTQNQLVEIGAEVLPMLKQFGIERNHYDTAEAQWHRDADRIANRWEKLAPNFKRFDKAWKTRNRIEQMLIADVMHEMTVSGEDPRQASNENAGLQAKYDKLLPESKKLLDDVEDFHKRVTKELIRSITDKIMQSEMPSANKDELIRDITDKFKAVDGPYFPLMRFGQYWVDYSGGVQFFETKAEQDAFIKQSELDELTINGYGKSLQNFNKAEGVDIGFVDNVNELIDKLDVDQSEQLKDGIFQLYLTALPETSMRKRFIHRKKKPGWERDALRSFAKKAFHDGKQLAKLKYAPKMRKVLADAEEIVNTGNSGGQYAQLRRRIDLIPELLDQLKAGVPYQAFVDRYDQAADLALIRKFNRYQNAAERQDAMLNYLDKQEALLKAVDTYKQSGDTSETAADILKALHTSYANMMESNTSPVTNFINQSVFTYFLGFNPSSAIINYFQTPGVALPVIAGRHGMLKASKAMADASKAFFSNRDADGFSIRPGLKDVGEIAMYNALTANGTFDRTRSHDLAGLSEEGVKRGTLHRDFMLASTYMFHAAEVANREITALTAYRMEYAKTGNTTEAIQYANDVVRDTHLDYSAANRPDLFQGNAARVMLQFKMYSQGMTYLWGKTAYDAMTSKNPERKAEAKNILLSLIGVQTAAAGLLGLPIGGILLAAQALANLGDDDDEPVDIEIEIRKALANVFGPDIGRILSRGVLSETGADFHGRLSLSDLWFREPDRELEGKDQAYYLLKTVVGPVGGLVENMAVGMKLIGDGHAERGLEQLLPNSVKGAAKAYRMIDEGGATSLTGNMLYETNAYEKALQALGMRPSGLSERQLQNSAIKNREMAITDAKATLLNRAALAKMKGDDEAFQSAWDEIKAFNAKYPALRITPKTINQSVKSRRKNQSHAEDGLVVKPKLRFVREEEQFL